MSFDNRLTTLMNLFKISNLELANGIHVDSSLISRWKSGERKVSANSPHIHNIILYFLSLTAHEYQKNYLERIIDSHLSGNDRLDNAKRVYVLTQWLISPATKDQKPEDVHFDRNFFENSPHSIAVSRAGCVLYVNPSCLDLLGYDGDNEILGSCIDDFIAEESREDAIKQIKMQENTHSAESISLELHILKRDGGIFPAIVEVKRISLPDGPANIIYLNDISDRKHLESRLSRQVSMQALLLDISKAFTKVTLENQDDLLNDALMRIGIFDLADRCHVCQLSEDETRLTITHEWRADGILPVQSRVIDLADKNWARENIQNKEWIYIPSLSALPASAAKERDILAARSVQSVIIIPLLGEGKMLGYIGIESVRRARIWPAETIMLLESVAQIFANSLIQKKYLMQTNANYCRKLLMQTVSAIAAVVEIKDPYTFGHQKNVSNLSEIIALNMGMDSQALEAVFVASALHDIGKISVPGEILGKPGKLTPYEYEIVKNHCQIGYEIIKGIEFPWPIAEIIRQHHERLDGSGYPYGLSGDDIHPVARIIAVADTVEAISSRRPYRPTLGINKALEEITQHRGSKYDAAAVDACVRLFTEQGYILPG